MMGRIDEIKKRFEDTWNSEKGFSEKAMCEDGEYRMLENPNKIWLFFEKELAVNGATSDGYHTFDELYEHRIILFIKLCEVLMSGWNWVPAFGPTSGHIWRSKLHSDGSSFDGWFIMGIFKEKGKQITYHLPMDRWVETEFAETLERSPEFDGHTPNEVLVRIKSQLL